MGYSLEWVASEVGVSPRRIKDWIREGLLPGPGRGRRDGYDWAFVAHAKVICEWLQLHPRGPVDNLRSILLTEAEEAAWRHRHRYVLRALDEEEEADVEGVA